MQLNNIEKKVLEMIIAGQGNMYIADEIGYSESTVKRIVKRLFNYFKVFKRVELVREAMKKMPV